MTWVSITDRLPDKDCAALVTNGRHVTLAEWMERDGWVFGRGDKAFGITVTALTHWMPLPAPPDMEVVLRKLI